MYTLNSYSYAKLVLHIIVVLICPFSDIGNNKQLEIKRVGISEIFNIPHLTINIYTVFQKSDAKIEITITTINLISIRYPLSSFYYRLSGANVASFNKIHCTVFEQHLFKNGTQKQKFPIRKSRLSNSYTMPSVTVSAQSGRHLHRHLHVSCADRTFSAAARLPVCRPCSVNLPQKSVQC